MPERLRKYCAAVVGAVRSELVYVSVGMSLANIDSRPTVLRNAVSMRESEGWSLVTFHSVSQLQTEPAAMTVVSDVERLGRSDEYYPMVPEAIDLE